VEEQLLASLLSDARQVVAMLLTEAPLSVDRLTTCLDDYEVEMSGPVHPLADLETASSLLEGCRRLLEALGPSPNRIEHLFAHVAVRYFVLDDDGDDDQASPFGYDDDVEVFNAVVELLGRPQLQLG